MIHCQHKVQFYETDQMGIVHHSNYIRWFEEVRTHYLEEIKLPYQELEQLGFGIPVLGVEATYLRMVKFSDVVTVEMFVKEYNGIKMTIGYRLTTDRTGMVHCTGETKHCFLTHDGKPVSVKKDFPQIHARFLEAQAQIEEKRTK